jgi:hypothetical protein
MDGLNLMPVLLREQPPVERTLYWRTFQRSKEKALRMGEWKYLQDEKGEYLFNVSTDQGEKSDLRVSQPRKFALLKAMFSEWEKSMLPPVPLQSQQ